MFFGPLLTPQICGLERYTKDTGSSVQVPLGALPALRASRQAHSPFDWAPLRAFCWQPLSQLPPSSGVDWESIPSNWRRPLELWRDTPLPSPSSPDTGRAGLHRWPGVVDIVPRLWLRAYLQPHLVNLSFVECSCCALSSVRILARNGSCGIEPCPLGLATFRLEVRPAIGNAPRFREGVWHGRLGQPA